MCEQLWDLRSKRSVHTLGEQYQVLAVAFGEEGDQVYTGGIENSIKVQLRDLTPCVETHNSGPLNEGLRASPPIKPWIAQDCLLQGLTPQQSLSWRAAFCRDLSRAS